MNVFSADVALAITRLGLLILLGWFMARQGWVGAHARQQAHVPVNDIMRARMHEEQATRGTCVRDEVYVTVLNGGG